MAPCGSAGAQPATVASSAVVRWGPSGNPVAQDRASCGLFDARLSPTSRMIRSVRSAGSRAAAHVAAASGL